jgi:hypothetical protein
MDERPGREQPNNQRPQCYITQPHCGGRAADPADDDADRGHVSGAPRSAHSCAVRPADRASSMDGGCNSRKRRRLYTDDSLSSPTHHNSADKSRNDGSPHDHILDISRKHLGDLQLLRHPSGPEHAMQLLSRYSVLQRSWANKRHCLHMWREFDYSGLHSNGAIRISCREPRTNPSVRRYTLEYWHHIHGERNPTSRLLKYVCVAKFDHSRHNHRDAQ